MTCWVLPQTLPKESFTGGGVEKLKTQQCAPHFNETPSPGWGTEVLGHWVPGIPLPAVPVPSVPKLAARTCAGVRTGVQPES